MKRICKMLPVFLAAVFMTGCATNIKRASGPPAPPSERFGSFKKMVLLKSEIAPAFAEHEANQAAVKKIDENLEKELREVVPGLEVAPAGTTVEATAGARTLVIAPTVEEVKFIGGAARFWAGAMAGSSAVYMTVDFSEAGTGNTIGNPEFYQQANAYGGAWTFGATDNNMLVRVATLIADYVEQYMELEAQ